MDFGIFCGSNFEILNVPLLNSQILVKITQNKKRNFLRQRAWKEPGYSSSLLDQLLLTAFLVISILSRVGSWFNLNLARRNLAYLLPIFSGIIIWFIPPPLGVESKAWHLLAIFAATIVGFITQPMAMSALAVIALVIALLSNTLTITEGLSGFSSTTSWLTFSSFIIAKGIIKTRLGTRIAYLFMLLLGKNALMLSYGILATDLILSPAMPSGNARAGGIIFPLVQSLAKAYGSEPRKGNARKIGAFLMQIAYQGTQITTTMFLTAMVANPLMARLAEGMGVEISWIDWALAALVPGGISLLVMPLVVYIVYPPDIKHTPEASNLAQKKLTEMDKISTQEWLMAIILLLLLFLWIFGHHLGGITSATTALLGVALLLGTEVLTWQDVMEEKKAWNILIWFSILLMMATFLNEFGLIAWMSQQVGGLVNGLPWQFAFLLLSIVYFYGGYFFASKAARASAMFAPFLSVAIAVGTPPMYAALMLISFVNLSGCLTPYATAEAAIYYSAGYVDTNIWWKLGFILSLVYIPIWLILGGLWWKILGLW